MIDAKYIPTLLSALDTCNVQEFAMMLDIDLTYQTEYPSIKKSNVTHLNDAATFTT